MSDERNYNDNEHTDDREKVCYMCHRTESRTVKTVRLPGNMHICTDCLQKMIDSIGANGLDLGPLGGFPLWGNNPMSGNRPMDDLPKEAQEALPEVLDENGNVITPETEEKEEQSGGPGPRHGMPNISFINLADLQQGFNRRQQVKKKKERTGPLVDPEKVLPPHKLKEKLESYLRKRNKSWKKLENKIKELEKKKKKTKS